MAQKSTISSLTETHQSFSISLEYRLMPFCTFVEKSKYGNNRKYENKQSENAKDKISVEFLKFSLYFYLRYCACARYLITNGHSWELAS